MPFVLRIVLISGVGYARKGLFGSPSSSVASSSISSFWWTSTQSQLSSPIMKMLPTTGAVRLGASAVKQDRRMRSVLNSFLFSSVICLVLTATLNIGTLKTAYQYRYSLVDTFVHARYALNVSFTEVRP